MLCCGSVFLAVSLRFVEAPSIVVQGTDKPGNQQADAATEARLPEILECRKQKQDFGHEL